MGNENLNFIKFEVLEEQADIILRALELYSYNLEYMISEKNEVDLKKLTLLSSVYEKINSSYNSALNRPRDVFDVSNFSKNVIEDYKKEA